MKTYTATHRCELYIMNKVFCNYFQIVLFLVIQIMKVFPFKYDVS